MARSLNKVILIGNLGNDPEVRTAGGSKVAQFSLATSRTWNDQSGNRQEKTEWHKCVAWNTGNSKLADIVEQYCRKGKSVYVEGSIEYRQWQDKEGQTRYTTEIKVRELLLLGGPRDGEEGGSYAPRPQRAAAPAASKAASGGGAKKDDDFADFPGALEDEDDDLPF
ncbi:MAG: single-stranded DNA-binding protein [Gemmatimonadaceae bacterium]|jgi:single-strand DNA-binding protein|nr:single-stranded DNA-binding protein [Gemmatimonadaceae bacterium]